MALSDRTQVSINLSGPVNDWHLQLAKAYGIDPGEFRRSLFNEAVKAELQRFREIHGVTVEEYLEKEATDTSTA